jgi:hypothetical protein
MHKINRPFYSTEITIASQSITLISIKSTPFEIAIPYTSTTSQVHSYSPSQEER